MGQVWLGALFAFLLLVGCPLMLELGRRAALRTKAVESAAEGSRSIEASVFALLGLLLAFTFSGALNRFDVRRGLIVEESNAIGTAWLRLDLLPAEARRQTQALFLDYVQVRLDAFAHATDAAATDSAAQRTTQLQLQIWSGAMRGLSQPGTPSQSSILLVPALNAMFDITTTREMAALTHPPRIVFAMLFIAALLAALLAGYTLAPARERSLLHYAVFAVMLAGSFYVIVDIEFPRQGLVTVAEFDRALVELQQQMRDAVKSPP